MKNVFLISILICFTVCSFAQNDLSRQKWTYFIEHKGNETFHRAGVADATIMVQNIFILGDGRREINILNAFLYEMFTEKWKCKDHYPVEILIVKGNETWRYNLEMTPFQHKSKGNDLGLSYKWNSKIEFESFVNQLKFGDKIYISADFGIYDGYGKKTPVDFHCTLIGAQKALTSIGL